MLKTLSLGILCGLCSIVQLSTSICSVCVCCMYMCVLDTIHVRVCEHVIAINRKFASSRVVHTELKVYIAPHLLLTGSLKSGDLLPSLSEALL